MSHEEVTITTGDGDCPTHVLIPDGEGPWPVVIVYMDALGMRPAIIESGERLAANGFLALLPDLFYRSIPYDIPPPKEAFAGGDLMKIIGPYFSQTNPVKAVEDTRYLLEYLEKRGDVRGSRFGTVGFCMGGGMALAAAGAFPDRVAAAASFHGGNIATDQPDSPHQMAINGSAEIYIAGADNDQTYPPEMHERLKRDFDATELNYRAEIYEGALHGWMNPDFPIYNAAAAERGWREMIALFKRNLG